MVHGHGRARQRAAAPISAQFTAGAGLDTSPVGHREVEGDGFARPCRLDSSNSKRQSKSRIYQQTLIDTYTKVSFAKLYDRKTPITAADLLNDRVLPFFEEHDVKLLRVHERHEYELYLAVVPRQNPDADLRGCNADDEGENDRGLMATRR
jgi:hypothetical protein